MAKRNLCEQCRGYCSGRLCKSCETERRDGLAKWEPTPAEIAEKAAAIRSTWSRSKLRQQEGYSPTTVALCHEPFVLKEEQQ